MKYLEQRVEELEKEVTLLKAKNKLEKNKSKDYMYNHSKLDPDYPNIIGSWDDFDKGTCFNQKNNMPFYPNDVIDQNVTDDYGFKMNYEEPITNWRFESKYDKMDKDFLKNSLELKIEEKFGKIVSKFRILNHEWEMDGYGYIVNSGIDCQPVVTNHGKPMIVDKGYLETKISSYKEAIQETQRALFLVK
jgi:hypothetical protein